MIFNETNNKKSTFLQKRKKIAPNRFYSTLKSTKIAYFIPFLLLWFKNFIHLGFDFGELFAAVGEELGGCFDFGG